MRTIDFKPHYVVPCWVFSIAFLVAALFFRSLTELFGVVSYFAISYVLIISLYIVIIAYIRKEIKVIGVSRLVTDLPKIYKDLRIGFFFPADSENKSLGFRFGIIAILFIVLPFAIYKRIHGHDLISYIPISVLVGFCVYGQARILFEIGCSVYSKGGE